MKAGEYKKRLDNLSERTGYPLCDLCLVMNVTYDALKMAIYNDSINNNYIRALDLIVFLIDICELDNYIERVKINNPRRIYEGS